MKWSNFKACPIVTNNIYGYLLFSFLLSLEDHQFSFFFFSSLDLIYHFLNPKKNSYSNGNSSFHMDGWKVHLAFKTNWLLQVMLWLHLTLGKTFSTLDPRARMWFPCCQRYIAKKKKVIEVDAKDKNWEVVVASKAIDEGPWPKMNTYVTIPYYTYYLSILIWCRKKTLLSTNFKIVFIFLILINI